MEIGLQPQIVDVNRRTTSRYPFDFVIGSSHVVHGIDPYYPNYYEGKTEDEAYREYFESILENIATDADYDVYGHLDYVVRYGPNKNKYYSYEKYADIIDEILRQLIRHGKGIEINTSSVRYGLKDTTPSKDIIKLYRDLGGKIITIGSDSHKKEHLGAYIDETKTMLKDMGFEYLCIFKQMKPEFIEL